jgi:hypothetical protein
MVPTDVHRAIEALNHEFAYRVDFGPSETVAELFTADGWYGWDSRRSRIPPYPFWWPTCMTGMP